MMFGVDALLISTGAFYQPAFVGTRLATNKASQVGLYRLRYVCGDRCWALAMSEVHVTLRGSMLTGTSNLMRQAGEIGANLSREDLEAVANEHGTDVDRMLEDVDSSTAADVLDSVPEDVNTSAASDALDSASENLTECRDAVRDADDDEDDGGDGGCRET